MPLEGPAIAPPNLDRDSGFKRPPKKPKRPTNLHGMKNILIMYFLITPFLSFKYRVSHCSKVIKVILLWRKFFLLAGVYLLTG
jgi:hypothetical protein